jgi:hypothetical protein
MIQSKGRSDPQPEAKVIDRFFVLIECVNEEQQVELLERFQREGLKCKALVA